MKSKAVSLLLSVVIAFGLWLYVVTVVSPDSRVTIRNIPVELEGEKILHENGLMVIKNETPTIDLQLEGNRSDLIKLNKSNITVTVDVTKIDSEGIMNAAYNVRYPGDIPDNAITVHSQDPGMVRLVVEKRIAKDVDVVLKYTGTLPKGYVYRSNEAEAVIDHIPVIGPASVLDKITQAVVTVDLTNQKTTINKELPFVLCDKMGQEVVSDALAYEISKVPVTVPVVYTKQVTVVKPEVNPGNGVISEEHYKIDYPKTITIYGSQDALSNINEVKLQGSIELAEFTATKEPVTKVMRLMPLRNDVKTEVDSVTVTIQFIDVENRKIELDLNKVKWNPQLWSGGYEIGYDAEKIEVVVRGTKELVEALSADSFVVNITTTNINVDTNALDIRVELAESVMSPELIIIDSPASLSVTVRPAKKAA